MELGLTVGECVHSTRIIDGIDTRFRVIVRRLGGRVRAIEEKPEDTKWI